MSTTYRSSVPQSHFVLFLPQRPRYARCAVPGANKELRRLITLRDHDRGEPAKARGRLKIGDDWNAITIIALSQSSPLKAIAELVENSIDAKAHAITITRGREHGQHFLAIRDDGEGVPRDGEGKPDFRYVATHICDSVKRRLKADGSAGLQGEFGIGLLSFWTVGEELAMTSTGADRRAYQMIMRKGDPGYSIAPKRLLFGESGTEVRIAPLLDGVRTLSGEKIQWYLAAELRDRIRQTGVRISNRRPAGTQAIRGRAAPIRRPAAASTAGTADAARRHLCRALPARAGRMQPHRPLPARHARGRRPHAVRSSLAPAVERALAARPPRCAVSGTNAGHPRRRHP